MTTSILPRPAPEGNTGAPGARPGCARVTTVRVPEEAKAEVEVTAPGVDWSLCCDNPGQAACLAAGLAWMLPDLYVTGSGDALVFAPGGYPEVAA